MTQDELKSRLHYDPETGVFTWLDKPDAPLRWRNRYVGKQAGTINTHGYVVIYLNNKQHYAHRLAFLYVYGYVPKEVDHIDGSSDNNAIKNLRDVMHCENMRNMKLSAANKSSVTGVNWDTKREKWVAQLMFNGKSVLKKRCDSFEEAVELREKFERKHGFHPNHGKR